MRYLKEQTLEQKLHDLFPNSEIIRNKKIKSSNSNGRPDFFLPMEKLIVEFDGYLHYSSVDAIIRDNDKDKIYTEEGFTIIRIPYFIQWCSEVVKMICPTNLENVEQVYPHGFIDPKALTPANYCELGLSRFVQELSGKFSWASAEILRSLKIHNDQRKALPPSLFHLFQ